MNCKETIKSIKFEEDSEIMSINNYSFYETNIESADLSNCNHLTLLNGSVFNDCDKLKTILFPQNISSIGSFCFYFNALTSIDLPDSVETICDWAFCYCGLTTIKISKNSKLKKLDSDCFFGTNFLTFFIPKFVNDISPRVFSGCKSLENITVDPENKYYKSDSKSVFTGTDNSTLFRVVPTYSGEYIVPSYVTNISSWCFENVNITSIQLHSHISWIENYAFSYCTSLTNIIIPESVTSIGNSVFADCHSLTNITIPESVTSIGEYAFESCTSLTNITILGSLTSIGNSVFADCHSLTNITIPESVTSIGNSVFADCHSLTEIIFQGNIEFVGQSAFDGCERLVNVTIFNNLNTFISCFNIYFQHKMNIFVPCRLILNDDSECGFSEVFPYESNLYITSQTVLSDNCKYFFGEKSVHVCFDNTTKFSDQTTIDVLQYISIENISFPTFAPKTIHINICYENRIFHLISFFINIHKHYSS